MPENTPTTQSPGHSPGAPPPAGRRIRHIPPWSLAHPLWLCPFRPFFTLALLSATALMALWGAFLTFGWPLPDVADGPFV